MTFPEMICILAFCLKTSQLELQEHNLNLASNINNQVCANYSSTSFSVSTLDNVVHMNGK